MNKFRILLGIIFLLLISIGGFYLGEQFKSRSRKEVCTQEAKLCPDGSSVSRTGPNCEFAPCQSEINDLIPNKIDLSLEEWLKTAKDNDSMKISLWIKENESISRPTKPLPDQITDTQQIDNFLKKSDQENAERVQKTTAPVVEKLTKLGFRFEANRGAPIIDMTTTKKFILELATWEEISNIYRADEVYLPN